MLFGLDIPVLSNTGIAATCGVYSTPQAVIIDTNQQLYSVEAARIKDYDVILMDMQMPDMDGLQATRIIRERRNKQPIIIALTANTMQGDQEECLAAGMNDYIGKPVKLEEVVTKLEKWAMHQMTG